MRMHTLWAATLLVPGLFFAAPAATQSFACDGQVVSVGDYKADVFLKCGEPFFRDAYYARGTGPAPRGCQTMEQWAYRRGTGQHLAILIFREGRLERIEYGGREP